MANSVSRDASIRDERTYTLTKSRLVDLDSLDTSLLKVDDLVAKRESELLALELARDIGTRERPVEDGDGPSEHTLHGLTGEALRVAAPANGHGLGAADVRNDDGRANVAKRRCETLPLCHASM